MIPAEYYNLIYTLLIVLFAVPVLNRYAGGWTIYEDVREEEPIRSSLGFTVFIILFVGLRPNSPVFADGVGYWAAILDHRWEYYTLEEALHQFATKGLMSFMSSNNISPRLGFIILSSITYGGAFVAMRKLFPCDTMLAMILFCGTFGTFGGAVNGIKSSCAGSMFLCALAYKNNWKICLTFLVLALGFHHSYELVVGAFLVCLFYKNTNGYYILWGVALIIAILHITYFQTLLAGYTDEHGAGYLLTNEDSWVTGFRMDFVLYSAAPLALGWWIKSKVDINGTEYQFRLNTYIVTNSIWLLCMYAAYTNRIAALSWLMFPILILDPILNNKLSDNQHKVLYWFVLGQLVFTLLMALLYL